MKIHFWLFIICALFTTNASAQKILQMEKRGKVKTKKFFLGEELTFKLKGQDEWITDVMIDIKVEEDIIVFSERFVKVSDIKIIKSYKNARRAMTFQRSLYTFGTAWLLYSLGGTLAGEPLNDLTWKVPATSFVLGFLIKKIFYTRKYRIGKKRRLRVLDLSFNKNMELGY